LILAKPVVAKAPFSFSGWLRYVPTLIFYENMSEEPALSESIEELTRQVDALEYQSCALM